MTSPRQKKLLADLAELKLHRIADLYQEVLDEKRPASRVPRSTCWPP